MSITPPPAADSQKLAWIDAHCHLQDPRLAPHLPAVLERARMNGIDRVHVAATSEADWPTVCALADAHPGQVMCSLGLHPWFLADRSSRWLRNLREALASRPAGIGEIGLDGRMKDGLDRDRETVFRAQLELSCELALPASVHCRDAWGRMLELLLAQPPHPAGLLIHAYSGPPDALPALAEKNVSVSFGGTLTRPNARRARDNARAVLPGHFLLESDAPDLPPTLPEETPAHLSDPDGKPLSEPAYVPLVGRVLADLRGTTERDIAAQTTDNASRLFGMLLT